MSVPEDAAPDQSEGTSAASPDAEGAPEGTQDAPQESAPSVDEVLDPARSTLPTPADIPPENIIGERQAETIEEYDTTPPGAIVVSCPNCASAIPLTSELDVFAPKQSTRYVACDECEGFGQVATGSHISEHAVVDCPGCVGQGYVTSSGEVPAPPTPPAVPAGEHGNPPWPNAQWDNERGMWV